MYRRWLFATRTQTAVSFFWQINLQKLKLHFALWDFVFAERWEVIDVDV
jgi:hypothetical protein